MTPLAARYDRVARLYDLVIGNSLYNRLVWGCPTSAYRSAAAEALREAGDGSILDCGCGSLVFTADVYREVDPARLTLLDASAGMLARAKARLPEGRFVQGDALALPFADASFDTVMSWGIVHVLGSTSSLIDEMARVLRPGGKMSLSTLTRTDRSIGNRMLGVLHRNGEAAPPETGAMVLSALDRNFVIDAASHRGSMFFVKATRR